MMSKTFMGMVKEAKGEVKSVSPADLKAEMNSSENLLVIDVRDAADIAAGGIIPGGVAISLGTLGFKADPSMPEVMQHAELGDFDRPIAVTCTLGAMAALGGKLLQDMGYTNVTYVEGGTNGWKDAGLDVDDFAG